MKLRLQTFTVTDVKQGDCTALQNGVLRFNAEELRKMILADARITDVTFDVARPGDSTRIVHVMDMVEPRVKADGSPCFPGFLCLPETCGRGTTNRLDGMALIGCAEKIHIPIGVDSGVLEFNEGIIEMSGPGQNRCIGGNTLNLCMVMSHAEGLTTLEFDESCRMACLKAADYLARVTLGGNPDAVEEFECGVADPTLPKFGMYAQIQSQGPMCRTFLYGVPMEGNYTPVLLSPTELMDGAVVSSNYRNQMRRCTWMQQNNFVMKELFRRHGKELNFMGMVLTRGHYDSDNDKIRHAQFAGKVLEFLGCEAAVGCHEATGNSNIEYYYTLMALERAGIVACPVVQEFGGPAGDDEPVLFFPKEAVSVVAGGAIDRLVDVPAVEKVIGGDSIRFTTDALAFTELDPHEAFTAGAHFFFGGFNALQQNGFRAMDF